MTRPSARNFAMRTGRRKLILSSTVLKDSPGGRVLANAMPMAASAMSQRMPPWMVPIGLKCFSLDSRSTTARPLLESETSKPISSATGGLTRLETCLASGVLGGTPADIDRSSIRDFDWMRRAEKSLRPVGFCGTLKLRSCARLRRAQDDNIFRIAEASHGAAAQLSD